MDNGKQVAATDLSDVVKYTRLARGIQNPAGSYPDGPWEDFYACDDVQRAIAAPQQHAQAADSRVTGDAQVAAAVELLKREGFDVRFSGLQDSGPVEVLAGIPDGWAFTNADFSIIAGGGSKPGNVTLIRAGDDRTNWMAYADADVVPLYAFGDGATFNEALQDAIGKALSSPPVPSKGGT